ncbi:GLABROUS1 enhancer-binding protein-like [Bidens hawaiensis]|uniref:GLABROUS1 enhancer-binding protein-like n=1 Tax=Bidens hawaiensis TaxID=980011 RepID=UPI00404ADA2E
MAGSESEIQPANSTSGDEAEHSSDGSESDPPPPPPPPSDQPDPTPTKPRSKTPIQSTNKRPTPTSDIDSFDPTKRVKTHPDSVVINNINNNNNNGEKKLLFQRLWSEENEVELIQGMIDYVKAKGKDPAADVNDFHEFVKQSLHVDVNDRQMLAKARRLKKKFENNVARVETKGKVRSFSNPHEKKMYELSKHLWGSDGGSSNNNIWNVGLSSCSKKVKVKVNVTPKSRKLVVPENGNDGVMKSVQVQQTQAKAVDGLGVLGSLGLPFTDEAIMRKGLELVSGAKKLEMEEKWKDLKMQELQHFMKKVDVLKEQAEIVFNAIAKSVAK